MTHHVGKTLAVLGAFAFACASPSSESTKIDPSLSQYVLPAVPADVPNPTLVDFGGKVEFVGWDVSPKQAKPGSTLSLKLYWRAVQKVAPGFRLYTHLWNADGTLLEFDHVGPLREPVPDAEFGKAPRLPPSAWIPGMVYVDEQSVVVPDVTVPVLTLSVGVKYGNYAPDAGKRAEGEEYKLAVVSGVSDGREGALVARLPTGVPRGGKNAPGDRDPRRRLNLRPGSGRPNFPPGHGPPGRMPEMDKENAQ